jgi:methylenetetrahydrofolate dehydrogenase (NADP+)/methenyltetrahydrofolate cyclohydrolase
MLRIYTGKDLKTEFEEYLKLNLAELSSNPKLNIIQIGDDFASQKYVQIKTKMAAKYGLSVESFKFPKEVSFEEVKNLSEFIVKSNQALIFQLPVEARFQALVDNLKARADADLLSLESTKLLQKGLLPPTILAIHLCLQGILNPDLELTKKLVINSDFLAGKTVAVIGQGKLVGKPMLDYLVRSRATIISVNEYTQNIQSLTQTADVLISATGKAGLIDESFVSDGTILIDAGTSESNGSLAGDVDKQSLQKSDKDITLVPSPGGIGKLTVLSLFWNVLRLSKSNI